MFCTLALSGGGVTHDLPRRGANHARSGSLLSPIAPS
jgi:hypothetical protein